MTKSFFYAAALILLALSAAFGQEQTPPPPAPSSTPVSLEMILTEAERQTRAFREAFKNLLAEEKKTFERFNKDGEVKRQTVVESTLLIYQSPKDQNVSTELRNVLKLDGEILPDSQKRSELLFAELQKASTVEKELEKIQNESLRYDKTLEINGITVGQAGVLSNHLRPFFDFTLAGAENFQGRKVYLVSYQQTRKSPYISVNADAQQPSKLSFNFMGFDLPKSLRNADAFLRGKLWIDAGNFQIWREERELTVRAPEPVVLLATTLEYQPSEYGILVPKRISLVANELRKNSKENQYTAVKDTRVTFDYTKFRKTEVDVRIIDDEP